MPLDSQVPFNDLARVQPEARILLMRAINDVLDSGWFVMGRNHAMLEDELALYVGVKHAMLVANGTDALELALAAVGVGIGDYVVTVANAGAYASIATRLLGGLPAYSDVDPSTLQMSAATFEAALSTLPVAPRAVVVTHLFGALAPVAEIAVVAKRNGIAVVEDCAQSLGARSGDRMGGTFGDIATTSFYPTKNLGALGDGGAVFTNDPDLAVAVRQMRQYGWDTKYHISRAHGRNSRMDELQAAIVRVKLPLLEGLNKRRRDIHVVYEDARPSGAHLINSSSPSFNGHLAVLTSNRRDDARATLSAKGIATDIHYPIPDHRQNFHDFVPAPTQLPVTEWASEAVFSVPLFPELTDSEVERVRDSLDSL
jgi:dTDP-4-amino-4,6-dideoxygalactose transaminase